MTAVHLPGSTNVEGDAASRTHRKLEWKLDPNIFQAVIAKFGRCDVGLFASRVNNQLDKYVDPKHTGD